MVCNLLILVVLSSLVVNAFREIDVELSHNILVQIGWTLATIAILYAVLQIKKDGVSWWRKME